MKILTKQCLQCEKPFNKPYYCGLPEWEGRKFCSKVCDNIWRRGKIFSPKTIFTRKRRFIPVTAFKKGVRIALLTEFKKGNIPWNKGKKMSNDLKTKLLKTSFFKKEFGDKSSNWRGGTTKLGQLIRSCKKYLEWRHKVFMRDKWTCVHCGRRRKAGDRVELNVDHIKPFYLIILENNIRSLKEALACKELWKTSNGRTLCVECHRGTETYKINQHTKSRYIYSQ
jgi:hypothetical protein